MADITQPDTGDQSFVASGDHRAELVGEQRVGLILHHPQVHRGQLIDTEGLQVLFDARPQLVRFVVGSHAPWSSRRAPTLLTRARFSG